MKILFATSEAYPFAMSGGLADVSGALPKALVKRLVGCRVVMPLYESVPDELRKEMKFLCSFTVPLSWRRQYCGVFEAKLGRVTYYLLDNQYYFKRAGLYGHYDDAERFAFFARAALELLRYIDYEPDVIHCNDWQTALLPVYKTLFYGNEEKFRRIKTLLTIHNIQYQGKYGEYILGDVFGIPESCKNIMNYDGAVNLLKGGIETADAVSTVSATYAKEILTPEYSHGLHSILKERSYKLSGIVNGIDTEVYDPETDPQIAAHFSAADMSGKAVCKRALQEECSLPVREEVPVIAMVTRLVSHKGLDLVKYCIERIVRDNDLQLVVLGSGDYEYESFFEELKKRFPEKVSFTCGFIPALAHKIYAGSDIFLMPSKSEPCGLAQMIALRYGTVPIVRETGGLKDTIHDVSNGNGNGFTFADYNGDLLAETLSRALSAYSDREGFRKLSLDCIGCDSSWARSAGEYIKLYRSLTEG